MPITNKGFVGIYLLAGILLIAVFAGGYYLSSKNSLKTNIASVKPSPSINPPPASKTITEEENVLYQTTEGKIIAETEKENQALSTFYFIPALNNSNYYTSNDLNRKTKKIKLIGSIHYESFNNPVLSQYGTKLLVKIGKGGDAGAFYVFDLIKGESKELKLEYKCCYQSLTHIGWLDENSIIIKDYTYKNDISPEKTVYWQINIDNPSLKKTFSAQ